MRFRLVYEGLLLGQNSKADHKWHIRKVLHPQLRELWEHEPLLSSRNFLLAEPAHPNKANNYRKRGEIAFVPLVTEALKLNAWISVLLFRHKPRGHLIGPTGDADNQLKTLIDALRMPTSSQKIDKAILPELPSPFFCLLEDDALVTKVSLETEHWLTPTSPENTLAIIEVTINKTFTTFDNLAF